MRRLIATLTLAGCLSSGGALAQSVGAPAGRDPATAPGGTTGLAGPRNEAGAVRSGDAVAVPPGAGGVAVPAETGTTPAPRPVTEPPMAPQTRP